MAHRRSADERFWSKVDKSAGPDGCWLWTGAPTARGYGQFQDGGYRDFVHRLSYEASIGDCIPDGMVIDHKCHVQLCVNPAHLQAVTQFENMQNRRGAQRNSTSSIRGVYPQKNGRWRVEIKVRGQKIRAGTFVDLAEAEKAARALRVQHMPNSLEDRTGTDG